MKPFIDPPGNTDILIVDDDLIVRSLFTQVLAREGYRVFSAADGRAGLDVLKRTPIPLLVTDIFMDEMDGIELITYIRRHFPGIKIIAISGGGSLEAMECLNMASMLGAHDRLAKPFSAADLIHAVSQLLPRRPRLDY